MAIDTGHYIDNRDQESMTAYLQDRIDALKRRVEELKQENQELKQENQELKARASWVVRRIK